MKTKFISHSKNTDQANLIVYFAGWATPPSVVSHLTIPAGYDLLICYDYQDLTLASFDFNRYQKIHLVAWSMGIWVAEKTLAHLPFQSATAINGTPFPKHDKWGIPVQIFEGTLQTLNEANRLKFERRICGDKQLLNHYLALSERRTLAEISAELKQLNLAIDAQAVSPSIHWDHVIIGEKDRIFPPHNQLAYWQTQNAQISQISEGEHYLWQHFSAWQQLWNS
ncbi:DUF452 family protein [Actinobacillus vicugnae]|uniref:DUF452 family protein n=1 Tax=Actinobacillus vicugnae TaxID=2573093 RepID=UPI00123EE884|nr:pimeloyl-ACP methyl esterase BioG family protein [Actinobacillus vicugnae]